MGLFSFLSKDKGLSPKAITKHVKSLTSQFAQPDVRRQAMDKLFEAKTPEAVAGLLRRFTVNASGGIADEEEKKWVEEALVELGAMSIEPIKEHIRTEKNITYPMRSLLKLTSKEETFDFLLDTLDYYGAEDYRSSEIKLQIVLFLSEEADDSIINRLLPYLHDHDDDVRLSVMDLILVFHNQNAISKEIALDIAKSMQPLIQEQEISPRIQTRVAELLVETEWPIPGDSTDLIPSLSDNFYIDKKRYLRKRFA